MFSEQEIARFADWHIGGAKAMEVFTRAAANTIRADARLANVNREDILRVLCKMAAFGFTPGIHAYISVRDGKAVFIADYRGVLAVWQEDTEIIQPPVLVRKGDEFEERHGIENGRDISGLKHIPLPPDGETLRPVIGGYIRWVKRGHAAFNVVDGATLRAMREKRVSEGSVLWDTHPDDMMMKEIAKRSTKFACTTAKMISLCRTDDAAEWGAL